MYSKLVGIRQDQVQAGKNAIQKVSNEDGTDDTSQQANGKFLGRWVPGYGNYLAPSKSWDEVFYSLLNSSSEKIYFYCVSIQGNNELEFV